MGRNDEPPTDEIYFGRVTGLKIVRVVFHKSVQKVLADKKTNIKITDALKRKVKFVKANIHLEIQFLKILYHVHTKQGG